VTRTERKNVDRVDRGGESRATGHMKWEVGNVETTLVVLSEALALLQGEVARAAVSASPENAATSTPRSSKP
jgi:hypothetical protein